MKRKLKDLLEKASNDIPMHHDINRFKTVKRAYNKGGVEEVIKTVNAYRSK